MKITSIKQQIKNPERASIFVDEKYSFSLSLNELVAEKLKIKQEINESDLKRLKKLSEDGKLRARTLEWVLNRPRSLRETKDYLFRKKAEPDQIAGLIEEFEKRGYLSDEVYAKWLIELRKRSHKSDRAIQNELMKKGVAREVLTTVFQKDESSELENLKEIYTKKIQISRYKNDELKLKQYLLRQGFSYDHINQVIHDSKDQD